jgi:hypothetical protein
MMKENKYLESIIVESDFLFEEFKMYLTIVAIYFDAKKHVSTY